MSFLLNTPFQMVFAADNSNMCHAPSFSPIVEADASADTTIEANLMTRDAGEAIYLSGEVELTLSSQSLVADEVTINGSNDELSAFGNITYESPNYKLQTEFMTLNQRDQTASFEFPSFTLPDRHARGTADKIMKLSDSLSRYQNIMYTTCDPSDSSWHLDAEQIDINQTSGRGSAEHATLYIRNVPVLYLPYLQFPIDDRRMSGMLTPTLGFSDANISQVSVPVYWNIAPNLDATITPAWYRNRGVQINTENRYLFKSQTGQVDLSHIDDDKTNTRRWFRKWQQSGDLGSGFTNHVVWREVSDARFFDDFKLLDSSDDADHLERHLMFGHQSQRWQSSLLWQAYQTPDASLAINSRPYRRLPRLMVNSQFSAFDNGLQFNIANEWVRFEHEDNTKTTGTRTHLRPNVSWEAANDGFFFKPKLEYSLTDYDIDNHPGRRSIQRNIPIFSLDTGLFFDRDMTAGNWTQTLEPRLYFLRTPFVDQSKVPVFDSAVLSDSYDNFFASNRFSGADRIGDANQVTLGIGSRILDNSSGAQLLYMRIGQIFYADDRRVNISGGTQTSAKSNIITETTIHPNTHLSVKTKLAYQQSTRKFPQKELSVNYLRERYAANLEYFFNDAVLEQAAVSVAYPINPQWALLAKYHQSLLLNKPVDNLFGVNYESCCWGIKILASETSNDTFTETDRAIFFELTLKGLGQAGRTLDNRAKKAIPGYQANF